MTGATKRRRSASGTRALSWKRVVLATALLAAVAPIVTAVLGLWPSSPGQSQTSSVSGTANQVNQAQSQVSVGPGGCVAINDSTCGTSPEAAVERRRRAEALPGAQSAPTGTGPWLFVVYDTGDMGLYVRDGTENASRRVGIVQEGRAVYVDCYKLGWDSQQVAENPLPAMRSDRWYKVRYPDTGDVGEFWMDSGFLLPINHNGGVPVCK